MKFTSTRYTKVGVVGLAYVIEDYLVQYDTDGIAERALDTSKEIAKAFGQLVEMLHDNGHLSDAQVRTMFNQYNYDEVEPAE